MKIYERWLQALLSSAPRSRVLARLASLAQIGELARRLDIGHLHSSQMKPCHWWIIIVQTKKFGEFTPLALSKFILHHLPDFILESLFIAFNLKNLTDFRKTMKTRADPHLSNGMSNQKAG